MNATSALYVTESGVGIARKTRSTFATFAPIASFVFIDIGMSIDPCAGICFPTMSTVVHVQLGVAFSMKIACDEALESRIVPSTTECGRTTPKSTVAGLAEIGPLVAAAPLMTREAYAGSLKEICSAPFGRDFTAGTCGATGVIVTGGVTGTPHAMNAVSASDANSAFAGEVMDERRIVRV